MYFIMQNSRSLKEAFDFLFELCRPGKPGTTATGRGVLSLSGLSHGVVRVDKEGSLTSLTLQDCGTVLPGGTV